MGTPMRPCQGIRRNGSCRSLGDPSWWSAGQNKGKSKAREMWVTMTRTEVMPRRPCGSKQRQSGTGDDRACGLGAYLNPLDVSLVWRRTHVVCSMPPLQETKKGKKEKGKPDRTKVDGPADPLAVAQKVTNLLGGRWQGRSGESPAEAGSLSRDRIQGNGCLSG